MNLYDSKNTSQLSPFNNPIDKSFGYHYNSNEIFICFNFVVSCGISYRGCANGLGILSKIYPIRAPHYTTIRTWILKLGYFKLMQPKQRRTDWVFIIDLTITIGVKKCMVILGTSLSKLRSEGFGLTLKDVEVLHMSVLIHSNHKTVKQALIDTSQSVGLPVEIISDYGSDVKKGIDEFCMEHKDVHFVYDVTHMTACKLKHIMEKDECWPEISKNIEKSKQQTKQGILSHLSPPCQRNKSRYLNLEGIIKWAGKMELYKEQIGMGQIEKDLMEYGQRDPSSKRRKIYNKSEAPQKSIELFNEKFGWIDQYKEPIQEYKQYMQIIGFVKKEIGRNGLSKKTIENIELGYENSIMTSKACAFKEDLLAELKAYLPEQAQASRSFLGRSDIIESLFGKYKYFNNECAMMGITQSVLIMSAITSNIEVGKIKEAMEFCKMGAIFEWTKNNIGETVFSKRKKFMSLY